GEGALLRVEGDEILAGGRWLAKGVRQSLRAWEEGVEAAKLAMGDELERFATNTLAYLREEQHLLTDSPDLPELRTRIKDRQVLVVVRGLDYREDLAALRSYTREMRPVLVAVDGGADALLEAGHRPDMIIGDFYSSSTEALSLGAVIVVLGDRG